MTSRLKYSSRTAFYDTLVRILGNYDSNLAYDFYTGWFMVSVHHKTLMNGVKVFTLEELKNLRTRKQCPKNEDLPYEAYILDTQNIRSLIDCN